MKHHTAFINLLIGSQVGKIINALEDDGYEVYSGFDQSGDDTSELSSVFAWEQKDFHIQMAAIRIGHNTGEDCEAFATKLTRLLTFLGISHCGIMVAKEPLSFAITAPNIAIGQRKQKREPKPQSRAHLKLVPNPTQDNPTSVS
jgi:hypothetical protein